MNQLLLEKLKALQTKRGDVGAIANHDEFLPWSDSVSPLLEFDQTLYKKFKFWSNHVKSAYRMGSEHRDAIGESIGIVNQAITKLELQHEQGPNDSHQQTKELPYPQKFTMKWLYQHAPISLWCWLVGLLATAFVLGVGFSETKLYQLLKSTKSKPEVQQQELNKSSKKDTQKTRASSRGVSQP